MKLGLMKALKPTTFAIYTSVGIFSLVRHQACALDLTSLNQYMGTDKATAPATPSQFIDPRTSHKLLGLMQEKRNCPRTIPPRVHRFDHFTRLDATDLILQCTTSGESDPQNITADQAKFVQNYFSLSRQTSEQSKRIESLESEAFSPTTKISGEENIVLGGIPNYRQSNGGSNGAATLNYDLRFFLDTSFSGKDLLRIRLRSDNFNSLPFGSSNSNIFKLVKASDNNSGLRIDRAYYKFSLGEQWKLTIAAKAQINDVYAFKPTAYDSQILDLFNLAGAAGLYNKTTGPAIAVTWKQPVAKGRPYWTAAASFITGSNGSDSNYGLFNQQSALNGNLQIGYRSDNWGIAMGYRRGTDGTRVADANGTAGTKLGSGESSNNLGIGGYWQPVNSGWMPSISLGFGYTQNSTTDNNPPNSQSWALGLQWSDVLAAGNSAGFGIGQPANATGEGKKAWLYELFYRWQLSDNISTTAAVFLGTNAAQTSEASNLGGVIQTQFRF